MRTEYTGEALDLKGILGMLRSQGLDIGDEKRALHILNNVSYTRLKAYLVPLMEDRSSHRFRNGACLEDAYKFYGFDRRLRELIFHELEKIEISIRTRIAYATNGREKGYWYTNVSHFKNASTHNYILRHIKGEIDRSDNDAIISFRKKYTNPLPPSWLMVEATSIGTLSTIYSALAPGELKRKIAEYYGLPDTVFASWLHHIVYVRNTCAHHNRLWNNRMSIRAQVPHKPRRYFPEFQESDTEHIYFTLCIIKYLVNTIKPENTFTERLTALIDNFPDIDTRKMGFPVRWKEDRIWTARVNNDKSFL